MQAKVETLDTHERVPCIGRGFRLQWEPVQSGHVLLYPEGMVKLNASAGEILKRCDGTTPVEAIVADLETAFQTTGLERDVRSFLDLAAEQRWIEWK
jgi:pyrroloquinoline quinone biosynthesis protein D